MQEKKIPLLVVAGPTASGKTALGVALAKRYGGEIVSADSMQIYRDIRIGTARPTEEETEGIPHHLMGFLPLQKAFSVSDYVTLARERIADIHQRGKLPIVVGGTGLYISSLIDHVQFSEQTGDAALREKLYAKAAHDQGESLHAYLNEIDPEAAAGIHPHNLVRLVRAVELYELTGMTMTRQKELSRQEPSPYALCMLGLSYKNRQDLYDRINLRVELMMQEGLLEEASYVLSMPDLQTAGNAIGYKEFRAYLKGEATLSECVDTLCQESRRYAKRQLTWFRRDERIHWLLREPHTTLEQLLDEACAVVDPFLEKNAF